MPAKLISPIGGPGQQFFDDNGDPLSGGKVYTYAAGTSDPAGTWANPDGTSSNPNPTILDAAGRVQPSGIWLDLAFEYKFVLKSSTDVTIGTWDQIGGSSDSTTTTAIFSGIATDISNINAQLATINKTYISATRITSNVTYSGTNNYIVAYNGEEVDLNGDYDPVTFTFTAPHTGPYDVFASVFVTFASPPAANNIMQLSTKINGSFGAATTIIGAFTGDGIIMGNVLVAGSCPVYLTAGDTVQINLSVNLSSNAVMAFGTTSRFRVSG